MRPHVQSNVLLALNAKLAVAAPLALHFFSINNSHAESGASVQDKRGDALQRQRNSTSIQQHRNALGK